MKAKPRKQSNNWLAGVKTAACIHYAAVGSMTDKVGWTPYAACAERYRKWQAEKMAHAAVRSFGLEDGVPCVQHEDDAFKAGGTKCELLNREPPTENCEPSAA